ncbi:MAG: ATP-binding protein [Bacteroidales bacterium]|nr:ATP-binding protein [Bacteroidales bacterium]
MRKRRLVLHNDVKEIPSIPAFLEEITAGMNMPAEVAMGINLALEEAVSNVMMYAYPEGTSGLVEIDASISKSCLELAVSDTGTPFNPVEAPEADTTLGVEERKVGGLGIHLIRTLMDSVSYRRSNGRNILTMTKKI